MTDKIYRSIIKKYITNKSVGFSGFSPVIHRMKGIKAVIFDVYGTLFYSEDLLHPKTGDINGSIIYSVNILAEKYRIPYRGQQLILKFLETIEKSNRLSAETNPNPEVNILEIWKTIIPLDEPELSRFALEFELTTRIIYPTQNLKWVFKFLKSRKIKTGILSNAQFYTEILLQFFLNKPVYKAGISPELTLYSYQKKTAKPSPVLFGQIKNNLEKMGIQPEETLFIGNDALMDIEPASKAGFKTALYFCGRNSAQDGLKPVIPDLIITGWKQLAQALS